MLSHKGSVGLLRLKQNSTLCCFRFGLPFVLYMERTVTWDALQKEILEKMRHLLRPGVYIQVGKMTGSLPLLLKQTQEYIRTFVFPI